MIKINNLNFSYKNYVPIISCNELILEQGKIYGLLGRNGSGKTTFLKLLSGIILDEKASINVNNYEVMNRNEVFYKNIFFLPETITFPSVSLDKFLKINANFYSNFDIKTFENSIEEFEIDRNKKLNKLSYGQQKLVGISFALACQTPWLFLDEPTIGLDIIAKEKFKKLLNQQINEDKGIIISTHQTGDIENNIDNLLILDNHQFVINESIDNLSLNFSFKRVATMPENEEVIYSENLGIGYDIITKNKSEEYTKIKIEQLFKAITTNNNIFKK